MMSLDTPQREKPVGTQEWYDFIGEFADAFPGMHLGGEDATHELLAMCRVGSESQVLDAGCGAGYTACLIAREYGAEVQGVDLSEAMIAQAKQRAHRQGLADRIQFRVADLACLPFEDDSFDIVIGESILIPLPGDKKRALVEMVRVVRPGGRIGINESTVDPLAPPEFMALLAEHPAIHGPLTPQALRDLFEASGLRVAEIKTETADVDTPSAIRQLGCRGLLSFMVRAYPKILFKLLRDARFRKASRIDDQVTKRGRQHLGYTLIAGQKPG
jgi:ubiquinone/menaquinone biosynthesis C-methylase UbiE